MPDASRTRTIAMPAQELWEMIRDPHHLPRWWPRVTRVEDVDDGAFTEVMKTRKGKLVRADFKVIACDDAERSVTWSQQIEGTPFARVLSSAETTVLLTPAHANAPPSRSNDGESDALSGGMTVVKIELRQRMVGYSTNVGMFAGFSSRFGSPMVRRAARATIDEALDGLERIGG
jgi:uncharacterized protein YndB with AHSA1/START domain